MLRSVVLFVLTLLTFSSFAKDVVVFEKRIGEKEIILVADNRSGFDYEVELSISGFGYNLDKPNPVIHKVPANSRYDMVKLTAFDGYMQYKVKIRYTRNNNAIASAPKPKLDVDRNELIVFTRSGCNRCFYVTADLEKRGIKYKEYNIDVRTGFKDTMWSLLQESGYSGKSIQMPVVLYKRRVHYNIPDILEFSKILK